MLHELRAVTYSHMYEALIFCDRRLVKERGFKLQGLKSEVWGPFVTFELFVRKIVVNAHAKKSCEFEQFC